MSQWTEVFDAELPTDAAKRPEARQSGKGWGTRFADVLIPLGSLVACVALWELAVIVFKPQSYLLPSPVSVAKAFGTDHSILIQQSWPTLQEILAGFGLSVPVGVGLAVVIVSSRAIERAVYPLLVASQVLPKVAVAPLLLVWFGFGLLPKVLITFFIAFFPIVIETAVGLRSLPPEMVDLARAMGASRITIFTRFRFPNALPSVFGGLKVAMTLAVIGAVVGEFVGADRGLGYVLTTASGRLDTDLTFEAIIVLMVIGIVFYMVIDAIERIAIRWHVSMRPQAELRHAA